MSTPGLIFEMKDGRRGVAHNWHKAVTEGDMPPVNLHWPDQAAQDIEHSRTMIEKITHSCPSFNNQYLHLIPHITLMDKENNICRN